jgi:hypothetical protein
MSSRSDRREDPEGRDIFESDEELHEFLEYTYAARRTELA